MATHVPNSCEDTEVSMTTSHGTLEPTPAISGLLDLFATHPLVALGEVHMLQEQADFVTALLHHPSFPATVQVIVVEFGNARYQALMDRFIAGEPIAARDLRPVWRDFFGWGFDAPIYEQFFRTVRGINRTLPSAQRLRVCLGDPPVDWTQITRQADIFPWLEQRDAHYAAGIETAILAPGYHGLLIAGVAHFARAWPIPLPPDGTIVHRIERMNTIFFEPPQWTGAIPTYHAAIAPAADEADFPKSSKDGFQSTNADYYLRSWGITTLLAVGFALRSCLYHTCMGARQHNYRVILLRDCTTPPGEGEFPDTRDPTNPEGGWMRFVFLRQFETSIGYTATGQDFVMGCRAIAHQSSAHV